MASWWHERKPKVLGWIVYHFVRALGSTYRIRIEGKERFHLPGSTIFLIWHGRTLIVGNVFRKLRLFVIISHSRDGEMQAGIFRRMGYQIIRGSTGRGGERALVESIRALRGGGSMAITPDGPRGPSGVVQGGALMMAKKSGSRIVPVGAAAAPRTLIKSWDKFLVPWPFARGVVISGEPVFIPPDADEAKIESIRLQLEETLNRLQEEAEAALAGQPKPVSAPN